MQKFIYAVLYVFLVVGAEAVIVAGGGGAQNTNAPTGGQGWGYVGLIDHATANSSVTYISYNWFITAYHIKVLDNPSGILLGGSSYSIDPNSWTRLTNSSGGNADLTMFRVVGGTVGLPGLAVRSSSTSNGSDLTMIGNGRNRQVFETHWDSSWVEVSPPPPATYSGYKWAAGSTKRRGTNIKDADAGLVNDGYGITEMFRSDFDDIGGDEAQGAIYDSGGGVFYDTGSKWELAGIMLVAPGYSGQPGNTSVYGNRTYMADMQYYATQISNTAQISDIDEDGIPDEWEYEKTGSTIGVVASADQDGDGFTGEAEWMADTDPTVGTSHFQVLEWNAPTNVVFISSTNRLYSFEYKLDLADSSEVWTTEVDWFAGSDGQTETLFPDAASNRIYRIRAKLR